ncbi:AraC family transcriptional regulator [Mucilaginibacter paludis]|uniref:Transcriptional regulator, AraC family n=1 Tax=Mucilaginibacter paludis DSM 18603 TaxID=714943 RepID=H1YAL8_9SPHI|nr:AraC family transcriptional regulator [Mucilaginibacter paludis]EHQ29138.1 transcriptional regulator, AraC family [Mucilaginibacter paludis DSM 18603]
MIIRKDNAARADYVQSINKAIRFIDLHLDEDLTLEMVAAAACYSPFHFHRVFSVVTKETLNAYITRRRLEKAASVLMRKKEVGLTEIYLKYGFNSNSSFTRTFKKFYGLSPMQFRNNCPDKFSKIRQADSKNGQKIVAFDKYICNMDHKQWMEMNASIEVKEMPQLQMAYIAHVGHDNLAGTFERLMRWARPKGLMDWSGLKMATIYHDSFKITAPDKVRMSSCMLLQEPVQTDGEIATLTINKGKFIVGRFEMTNVDFEKAWTGMFIWLHENGYKTTDRNPFELYHNDYRKHPENKFIVDLCIPVD